MKMQSIKPLQFSVKKLQQRTSKLTETAVATISTVGSTISKKKEKKQAQNSGCEPLEHLDPMKVATKATVLVHSLPDNKEGSRKQQKNMFRRKKDVSIATDSIGTAATDVSTTESKNNESKIIRMETCKNQTKEKVQLVKVMAREQYSLAAEKAEATRETMKRVKNIAQEQCSTASKKTIVKITDFMKTKKQPMLTTSTEENGVEISLASLSLSLQNERFQHLKSYRRAAGKKCAKVAQKLSSTLRKGGGEEEDRELEPLDESSSPFSEQTVYQEVDCPICLNPMSEEDWEHPLQCKTLPCHYNFCASCISKLIESSKDAYCEASDGSQQVKVHLTCPNCRDNMGDSLKRTLLLRLAEDSKKSPSPRKISRMLELVARKLPFQQSVHLTDKQKMMQLDHLDMEVYRARAQERDFWRSCNKNKLPPPPMNLRSTASTTYSQPCSPTSSLRPESTFDSGTQSHRQRSNYDEELQMYNDLLADGEELRLKRESSFLINQTTCFYIDTQVNLGGSTPHRLRFQM